MVGSKLNTPQLQKFSNHFLTFPSNILVVGATNTGKTAWVTKLLSQWDYCMSPPDTKINKLLVCYNGKYQDYYDQMINESLSSEIHQGIPEETISNPITWESDPGVLVLDDFGSEHLAKNSFIEKVFQVYSHHLKFTTIMILQTLTEQKSRTLKICLKNAHYIILMPSSTNGNFLIDLQRMLFPGKGGILNTCAELCFDQPDTDNYPYMIIDCTVKCPSKYRIRTGIFEDDSCPGKVFMPSETII